jgi:hypothetical protein
VIVLLQQGQVIVLLQQGQESTENYSKLGSAKILDLRSKLEKGGHEIKLKRVLEIINSAFKGS